MMGYYSAGWPFAALMMVLMIAFWGLVIWASIRLIRSLLHPRQSDSTSDLKPSVIEVLKRRYAAGEIGKEEFEAKKHDIS